MKKGSKKKPKSVSTPKSMFSGARLTFACTDSHTVLWLVQGHNIVSMRVNDVFCLLSGYLQGWCYPVWAWHAHLRLCEKCGALLQPRVPIFTPTPAYLPPPFPFNSSAKIPPTEQKITLILYRGEKSRVKLLQLGPMHECECTHEEGDS